MKLRFLIFSILFLSYNLSGVSQEKRILPHTVIFKLKDGQEKIPQHKLEKYLDLIQAKSVKKIFPNHYPLTKKFNNRHFPLVDLSLIYRLTYNASIAETKVAEKLASFDFVEYAEPYYLPQLCYEPNDPKYTSQYALTAIHALDGWNLEKGDSTIVVGIVDCGIDFDHEDIHNQVAYNNDDPPNGVDDDNDGYIDNFRGWDLGNNDADPTYDEGTTSHGLWVAGAACARVDNDKGIAGVGFRVKFLPVKVMNSDGIINRGYEGIVYAADHGCSVINCSWGSFSKSRYAQDVINYATYNKNALVVAAAGNNGDDVPFYPASYENVLSVAGTNPHNEKWNKSSYGIYVDICAPGDNVLTTFPDNTYSGAWGTSFASPQVAAAAALVKSHYGDSLSALQLGEILKVTATDIDTITANKPFAGFLGSGLLTLDKALSNTLLPSVQYRHIVASKTQLQGGDTILITGDFINFLSPTEHLRVVLTTSSPYVTILDSVVTIDTLKTMQIKSNEEIPFKIRIADDIPFDETIDLKFNYSDTALSYRAFQYWRVQANPSYLTIHPNTIQTTLAANGHNGYYSGASQGVGFLVDDYGVESLYYESGLMMGVADNRVADAVRGSSDFLTLQRVTKENDTIADSSYAALFSSAKIDSLNLPFRITQRVLAWNDTLLNHSLWYRYSIENRSVENFQNFYIGLFTDWDLDNYSNNILLVDTALALSYCYSLSSAGIYAGVQLLSQKMPMNMYAIDNVSGGDGVIDISNGYSDKEKYYTMSHRRDVSCADGCDVAQVVSFGPCTINTNDTLSVTFAYLWAYSLPELKAIASANKQHYIRWFGDTTDVLISKKQVKNDIVIYPNPVSERFIIDRITCPHQSVDIKLISLQGKTIFEKFHLALPYSVSMKSYPSGIYVLQIIDGNTVQTQKIIYTAQ